jgi:hypothetical protein
MMTSGCESTADCRRFSFSFFRNLLIAVGAVAFKGENDRRKDGESYLSTVDTSPADLRPQSRNNLKSGYVSG